MATVRTRKLADGSPRYDVLYRDPDGNQRSKTYTKKEPAKAFANTVEADKLRGAWIDPNAGKVLFQDYADEWLSSRVVDIATTIQMRSRLKNHVYPVLGRKQMRNIKPSVIQGWSKGIDLADRTRSLVFGHVQAIFDAAIADEIVAKNPCRAKSVQKPTWVANKVVPWQPKRVVAVREALPCRYRVVATNGAGLGLRQGETFGLSPDDINRKTRMVHVQRQVKAVGHQLVFAPPKYGKTREVPLSRSVEDWLDEYLEEFPPRLVTLPWKNPDPEHPDYKLVTLPLIVTSRESKALDRIYFNRGIWKPALVEADVEPTRENGTHALRHFYASVLLDAGESIKAVSEYLGHADPGFTLRTYTHLMPSSASRTRRAIDGVLSPDAISHISNKGAEDDTSQ